MTPNIFTFVSKKLESSAYKSKSFAMLKAIVSEADNNAISHETMPGKHSSDVSHKNKGETAFQRALYYHSEGQIQLGKVAWCDIELPVTFSKKGRRRCVDLIGRLECCGDFLCELKYANPKSKKLPASNCPDYAVLEALLYYGLVQKNQGDLQKHKVWRKKLKLEFSWVDVAKSKTIMVLANESFWNKAKNNLAASKRICELVDSIQNELKVKVLLYKTPDFYFVKGPADKAGRYCPKIPDGADKWMPVRFEGASAKNP